MRMEITELFNWLEVLLREKVREAFGLLKGLKELKGFKINTNTSTPTTLTTLCSSQNQ
jgi:hypothetical protein